MWTIQPHPTPQIHFALKLALPLTTKNKNKNAQIHLHTLSKLHGNHRGLSLSKQLLKRLQDSHTHKPSKCSNNQQIRKSFHVQVYDF